MKGASIMSDRGKTYIEEGHKHMTTAYDLRVSEIDVFMRQAAKGVTHTYKAIVDAYFMGFEAGRRQTLSQLKKEP